MYRVGIPHNRELQTDQAIQNYLEKNPDLTVDEAVDAIFQIGVAVMNALAKDLVEKS